MNLLEYFKQYPILLSKSKEVDASDDAKRELSHMDSILVNYIPSGLDKRSEYRLTDEREFIRLHCIEGKSVEQTADTMCISRDTAYRIRRRLCNKEVSAVPRVS